MVKARRLIPVIAALLTVVMIASAPAEAKKKKKPKPVLTTLYMHGEQPAGEVDGAQWLASGGDEAEVNTMDPNEPSGGQAKSMYWGLLVWNDQCSGLPIGFPTWIGSMKGQIVGDAKMTVYSISAPGTITARLWVDSPTAPDACNEGFVQPASEVQGSVPSGQGSFEVVFPKLKLTATTKIMVELLGPTLPGRVLYDSTSAATKLEFMCAPPKGKKACA